MLELQNQPGWCLRLLSGGENGTVGLLLDLNKGTLSVFKNGRLLGVMKDGLGGEYVWFVSVYSPCTISMSISEVLVAQLVARTLAVPCGVSSIPLLLTVLQARSNGVSPIDAPGGGGSASTDYNNVLSLLSRV